jgi:hypothetical protein
MMIMSIASRHEMPTDAPPKTSTGVMYLQLTTKKGSAYKQIQSWAKPSSLTDWAQLLNQGLSEGAIKLRIKSNPNLIGSNINIMLCTLKDQVVSLRNACFSFFSNNEVVCRITTLTHVSKTITIMEKQ